MPTTTLQKRIGPGQAIVVFHETPAGMLGFLLTFAGCVLLAASMKKHWRQLMRGDTMSHARSRMLRALGYALLVFATIAFSAIDGFGMGLVYLCAWLTIAILTIALALPVIERRRAGD